MNVLDKLISDKLKWQIEQEKAAIRREALDEGFNLGSKATEQRLLDTGVLGTIEDTHTLKCMNCRYTIKVPCVNFSYKQNADMATS